MRNPPKRRPTAAEIGAKYGLDQTDIHEEFAGVREVVCHLGCIVGWESEGERATKIVGAATKDLKNVKILITARREFLYVHSNFIKRGCPYPTKISSNQSRELGVFVSNLIATEGDCDDPYFRNHFQRAMVEDFTYFVDALVLTDERYSFLDFRHLRKAYVLSPDGSKQAIATWFKKHGGNVEPQPVVPAWFAKAGFACGTMTLLFFMFLILFSPNVPQQNRFFVVVVFSLGASLATTFLTGSAAARGKIPIPFSKKNPLAFSASGGIAVLITLLVVTSWLYVRQ